MSGSSGSTRDPPQRDTRQQRDEQLGGADVSDPERGGSTGLSQQIAPGAKEARSGEGDESDERNPGGQDGWSENGDELGENR